MWQTAKPPATLSLSQGPGPYVMCFEKVCLHLRYYHTTNQACLLKVEGEAKTRKTRRASRRQGVQEAAASQAKPIPVLAIEDTPERWGRKEEPAS